MSTVAPEARWVLASGNAGKVRELNALLAGFHAQVIPQSVFAVAEAEETGLTFVENAILKARNASLHTGLPAIADDSGLEVDALGGAPGVLSARFAGEPKSDARNNALLLERLAGETNRRARFYCALALVRHADDPQPIIACGEWHGEILEATRGHGGFGYDPLFLVPELDQTAAEIDHSLKNVLSHRGSAMRQLLERLRAEQA